MNEIEGREVFFFFYIAMEKNKFQEVVNAAAQGRGCVVADIQWDDDDNVFPDFDNDSPYARASCARASTSGLMASC